MPTAVNLRPLSLANPPWSASVTQKFFKALGSFSAALIATALQSVTSNPVAAEQVVHADAVQAVIEGPPLAHADFDLYLDRFGEIATLIYVKDSCAASDLGIDFFVRVYPRNADVLTEEEASAGRRESEFRFWSADFAHIGEDGTCVAAQHVPDIDASAIETGQLNVFGAVIWSVRIEFSENGRPPAITVSPDAESQARADRPEPVHSHLYAFDIQLVPIRDSGTTGGAIEPLGNDLLVALPRGELALIRRNGTVEYLRTSVPMNPSDFEKWVIDNPHPQGAEWSPNKWPFRVADILAKQVNPDRWELFATHHYFTEDCIRFRLSSTTIERKAGKRPDRFDVSPDWRTVFDAEPCLNFPHYGHQAGGKMLTDGPDRLLIVIGDHSRDGWGSEALGRLPILPQEPDSHFGKLISVDIASGDAQILALGLRNPQGLARDRDGRVWGSDHGPQGGDELNLLEEGRNYGWPYVTYGLVYGGTVPAGVDAAEVGFHDGFAHPEYSWVPSIGMSAIAINDEIKLPLWKDDILVGSLSGKFFRVRRAGSRVIYAEKIKIDQGKIRDIVTMPDGRIALLFDWFSAAFLTLSREHCGENPNTVYRPDHAYMLQCSGESADTRKQDSRSRIAPPFRRAGRLGSAGDRAGASDGAALFASRCARCHTARTQNHDAGPHLVGLVGRRAGTVAGYNFSPAFKALTQIWTQESLVRFLNAPEAFAPDSRMPDTGVSEAQARMIVDYIVGGE